MTLLQIKEMPHIFRDTETGAVLNIRDFREFEHTVSFTAFSTQDISPRAKEQWILKAWSILLHPWPETIPPTIIMELSVNGIAVADAPLFAIAEPLARVEDQDLRDRIEAIEKKLEMGDTIQQVKKLNTYVTHHNVLRARVLEGHPKELDPYLHMEVFNLHLRGLKRRLAI